MSLESEAYMCPMPIIIVDDNLINLKLINVMLTRNDFQAYTATNATEALALLKTISPVLILMDIQLPGMDGLTLTRQLKADSKTHDIPIIALTAFAMKGDEQRALGAGCDSYISKPIDVDTFIETITGVINAQKKKVKG